MARLSVEEMSRMSAHWGWMLATGILYIILGVIAFSMPVASTIGFTYALACLLLVGGGFHLFHAFQLRHHSGAPARFLKSALAIVTGAVMLRYPAGGMLGLGMALSFYFFISAATQWLIFSEMWPARGSGWGLTSSLISFFLGVFIVMTFPFSALWVPGTLLGIDLVFGGAALIGLAVSIRSPSRESVPGGMQPRHA